MILEKIQHHLGLSFLLVLVFTQSMFFLGVKASVDARDNLQAFFMQPNISSNIELGDQINFRAQLYVPEQDELSWAYFTVTSPEQAISVNFDANLTEDGHWGASVPWDTTDWQAGAYQINATAYAYNADGVIVQSYFSQPQIVYLIDPVEYQMAQEIVPPDGDLIDLASMITITSPVENSHIAMDEAMHVTIETNDVIGLDGRFINIRIMDISRASEIVDSRRDVYDHVILSTGQWQWNIEYGADFISQNLEAGTEYVLMVEMLDREDSSIHIPKDLHFFTVAAANNQIHIINSSPATGSIISGSQTISLEFEPALLADEVVVVEVSRSNDMSTDKSLGPADISADMSTASILWNTADTEGDFADPVFPDNDLANTDDFYTVSFYKQVNGEEPNNDNMIHQVAYYIQNNGDNFSVYWVEPAGQAYEGNQIALQASTNRPASYLSFEIVNQVDHTISSGILTATSYDAGENIWVRDPYTIPSTWPDGDYVINITASAADGSASASISQPLTLARMDNSDYVFSGGDLYFSYKTSMTGTETLTLQALNWEPSDLANARIKFLVNDISNEQVASIEGADVISDVAGQKFLANFDTVRLSNGSYTICAKVYYQENEINSLCGSLTEIFNDFTLSVPTDSLGELDVEFFKPKLNLDEIYHSLNLSADVKKDEKNYYWIWENIDNDNVISFNTNKGFDSVIIDTTFNIKSDKLVGGHYRIYVKYLDVNSHGEETWSNPAPYTIDMTDADDIKILGDIEGLADGPIIDNDLAAIELYVDGDILHTGDNVYISANFYDELEMPTVGIKQQIPGDSKEGIKKFVRNLPLTKISCSSLAIPQIFRNTISELHHQYCWKGVIPKEGVDEYNNYDDSVGGEEKIVSDTPGYLRSGRGTIGASYVINKGGDANRSATSEVFTINFIFTQYDRPAGNTPEENVGENVSKNSKNKESLSFSGELNCLDFGIYNDLICNQFLAIMSGQIDEQCLNAGIYEATACENYLLQKQVQKECDDEAIIDTLACQDWLLEKYAGTVECALDDLELCTSILRNKYLNRLVAAKNKQTKISSSTGAMIGQIFTLDELSQRLTDDHIDTSILPLTASKEVKVLLAKSASQTVLESEDQLTVLHSAFMIVDTDADGLSDDMERYYGTDINNPDTDADSYLDGEEVANGYNPLGDGKLGKDRSTLDKIIATDNNLEQPKKLSKKIDPEYDIAFSKNEDNKIRLQGTAEPDTWLTIFLYSDLPLVMTTKTDESGNWVYDIQNSLVDGGHKVYVTVNDDTGTIVKQSSPLAFLVKSAQAVTADQYFETGTSIETVTDSMLWLYILGAVLLVVFGIIFIFILHRNKGQQI